MSQGTPRKFSEKIAILERKQNEEQEMFHSVMRDVRAITSHKPPSTATAAIPTTTYPCSPMSSSSGMSDAQCSTVGQPVSQASPQQICGSPSTLSAHPLAYAWNRSGGSLPNVHQMVDQQPLNDYATWSSRNASAAQGHQMRTRSPGAHYHPYRNVNYPTPANQKGERVPPLDSHMMTPTIHLQPPDPSWSRARSDPAIHMNTMAAMSAAVNMNYPYLSSVASTAGTPPANTTTSQVQMDYRNTNASYPSTPNYVQYSGQQSPQFQLYNNNLSMAQARTQPQQISQQQQIQHQHQLPQSPQQQSPQYMSQMQQQYFQQQQYMQMQQRQQQLQKQHKHLNNNCQPQMSNGPSSSPAETPVGSLTNVSAAMMQQCSLYNGSANSLTLSGQMPSVDSGRGPSVPTTSYAVSPATSSAVSGFQPNFTFPQQQQQLYQQSQQLSAMGGINASQSAPTSPAQDSMEAPMRRQWPPTRHFSASPDTLDIPNIVLTGADGTLDCFQDLQDLHLDNEIQQLLNDPCSNEQMDPALETQLLN